MSLPRPPRGTTSNRAVQRLIGRAEKNFRQCWRLLEQMRGGGRSTFADDLRGFQPRLADALYALSRGYKRLVQEEKFTLERKGRMSSGRLQSRRNNLESKKKAVRRAISIGRHLGDGFAWFFYRGEVQLIEEHAKHAQTPFLPFGLGGRGEVAFIKAVPKFQDHFVLYHGITSFLRVGDVSLIGFKPLKVVALGELKTIEEGPGELSIFLHVVSDRDWTNAAKAKAAAATLPDPTKEKPKPPVRDPERLRRQMERMGQAVTAHLKDRATIKKNIRADSLLKALEENSKALKPGQDTTFALEDGHAVYIYRHKARTIVGREDETPDFGKGEGGAGTLEKVVIGMTRKEDKEKNRLQIRSVGSMGKFGEGFLFGALPVFWWPLPLQFLKRLILGEIVAISLLNTARFTRALEAAGFTVEIDKEGEWKVAQQSEKGRFEMGYFAYFISMMQYALTPVDSIVATSCVLRDEALRIVDAGLPGGATRLKLSLLFAQRTGAMPLEDVITPTSSEEPGRRQG